MKRQETTNKFSEGLTMDFHPMTMPNNKLTNALNATILTYNGNEYILQNDMGNGRVESAYLPSGYVPLGIKEFGGIVYIASYNPLTGKGLIGSFPSPERNISSDELDDNNNIYLLFDSFTNNVVLRLKLFGEETTIRSGDRFSIIMNVNNSSIDLSKLLSHYCNTTSDTTSDTITCIKNKTVTLDVAILDSNNNLHVITEDLKRFYQSGSKINEEVDNLYKLLPEIKYNTEYFTQSGYDSEGTENTIDFYRSITARNTFNNKLIGNLCIIATFNTLSQFEFSIGGDRTLSDSYITLYLDSQFEYNCPDGRYVLNTTDDELEYIYGKLDWFDLNNTIDKYVLTLEYGEGNTKELEIPFATNITEESTDSTDTNTEESTDNVTLERTNTILNIELDSSEYNENISSTYYNEEDELYISNQLDLVKLSGITSGIISYTVTPYSVLGPLNGLQLTGDLNLDKLGTGEINLSRWKYYKSSSYVLLQWGLEAYPKYGESITSVRFEFYELYTTANGETVEPTYTYLVSSKRNYNGTFSEILHLPDVNGLYNRLFLVRIVYTLSKSDGNVDYYFYRWLFNTTLYNSAYTNTNITDFDLDDLSSYRTIEYNIGINPNFSRDLVLTNSYLDGSLDDSLVTYVKRTSLSYYLSPTYTISTSDTNKYPFDSNNIVINDSEFNVDNYDVECTSIEYVINNIDSIEKLVTINNYNDENFDYHVSVSVSETGTNNFKISFSGYSILEYIPEANMTVTILNLFTPVISSMEDYFGTCSNGIPTIKAAMVIEHNHETHGEDNHTFWAGIHNTNLTGSSNLDTAKLEVLTMWTDTYNDDDDGINWYLYLKFDSIASNWYSNMGERTILMLESYSFNTGTLSDNYWNNNSMEVLYNMGCVANDVNNGTYLFAYSTALWKTVQGSVALIDLRSIDSGNSTDDENPRMCTILYDTLHNWYMYNSSYSNSTVQLSWINDSYTYNLDYDVSININIETTLKGYIDTDDYDTAVAKCLNKFEIEQVSDTNENTLFSKSSNLISGLRYILVYDNNKIVKAELNSEYYLYSTESELNDDMIPASKEHIFIITLSGSYYTIKNQHELYLYATSEHNDGSLNFGNYYEGESYDYLKWDIEFDNGLISVRNIRNDENNLTYLGDYFCYDNGVFKLGDDPSYFLLYEPNNLYDVVTSFDKALDETNITTITQSVTVSSISDIYYSLTLNVINYGIGNFESNVLDLKYYSNDSLSTSLAYKIEDNGTLTSNANFSSVFIESNGKFLIRNTSTSVSTNTYQYARHSTDEGSDHGGARLYFQSTPTANLKGLGVFGDDVNDWYTDVTSI